MSYFENHVVSEGSPHFRDYIYVYIYITYKNTYTQTYIYICLLPILEFWLGWTFLEIDFLFENCDIAVL